MAFDIRIMATVTDTISLWIKLIVAYARFASGRLGGWLKVEAIMEAVGGNAPHGWQAFSGSWFAKLEANARLATLAPVLQTIPDTTRAGMAPPLLQLLIELEGGTPTDPELTSDLDQLRQAGDEIGLTRFKWVVQEKDARGAVAEVLAYMLETILKRPAILDRNATAMLAAGFVSAVEQRLANPLQADLVPLVPVARGVVKAAARFPGPDMEQCIGDMASTLARWRTVDSDERKLCERLRKIMGVSNSSMSGG